MANQIFRLISQSVRDRAVLAILNAADGWLVRIGPPKRTLEQNAKLHTLFRDLSYKHKWAGRRWSESAWKQLMVSAWMQATGRESELVPGLEGGFTPIFLHTSDLSVAEMSELIDYIQAWMDLNC